MGNILNALQKELLINLYKRSPGVKMVEFCRANNVSCTSFKTWMRQYDGAGLEGLYRSNKTPEILPAGADKTLENYKRQIIKLRIENERLKKNYTLIPPSDGKPREYVTLCERSTRS